MSSKSAWGTQQDPVSKKKLNRNKNKKVIELILCANLLHIIHI
jgi:hypothetical protein